MTPEEWKKVEQALDLPYGRAELLIDGYEVVLTVVQIKRRLEILLYINGWHRGEWLTKDCEERRRFMRPVKYPAWTASQKAKLTKGFTKKQLKVFMPDLDKVLICYHPYWPSFGPLKRHLIAHNKSIELKQEVQA